MNLQDRIIASLYDRAEGYASIGELAAEAGTDPAAVERALAELARRGQRLERSPSDGVRLLSPVRLTAGLVERDLPTRRIGRSVISFGEVASTNDVALEAIRQGGTDGLVVLAESQSRGRGRHGRTWASPPGRNILLSVLLLEPPQVGQLSELPSYHEALTIAAGVAAAEAIEQAAGLVCELKWPNDVLLEGAKVAGVLVDVRVGQLSELPVRPGLPPPRMGLVVGVGINVNAVPPPEAVDRPATCLADHAGHSLERVEIIRCLLVRLEHWVDQIGLGRWGNSPSCRSRWGDSPSVLDGLRQAFAARCRMVNQRAVVLCEGRRYAGRVMDVDPLHGLVLFLDSGGSVHLPAAASTVVG